MFACKRLLGVTTFCALLVYADYYTRQPLPGIARVTIRIHAGDGTPTGLRLRITNAAGDYFAPLGHLPIPDQTKHSSNDIILGDGQVSPLEVHALVYDGTEVDLPPGHYNFHANKGYEYDTIDLPVEIKKAERTTVSMPLKKFADFEARGWYPGDTHMHFPDPAGVRYEMECEGLRVCSLLLYKSGYKTGRPGEGHFDNVEHFTGRLSLVSDARHFVKVGEEFRHGLLAHLLLQNLKSIVWPVSVGGLREGGVGGYDWPMMMDAADDAHEQGALVSWAHWPYPSLEAPLDIALGRIDSIDLLTTGNPFQHHPILVDIYKMFGARAYSMAPIDVYYHYLNCGFHLSMSSGSDKMALNPPMGSARTYVKTEGALTYDSWIDGIRKGHTFASDYPLLEFSVNGQDAGETLHLNPGKAKLKVRARAQSLEPYDQLEIIVNGQVVRTVKPSGSHCTAAVDEAIEVERGGWIAARAYGRKMLEYGATWWKMPVMAHSSPIYLDMPGRPAPAARSAAVFLDQLQFLENWAERDAKFPTAKNMHEALERIREAKQIYQELATHE
jgi:hypothetical protein